MEDLISVIIPIYKVEKYLNKCIESVINQTYANLEIILVNDGSPDNSGKICEQYALIDKRIKVIHKENGGVSSARNIGLDNANGQYVTFIDADDFVENNYCESLINTLKSKNVDCVACGYNRVYNNRVESIIEKEEYALNNIQFLENIFFVQKGLGFCHMKLWKKSCINNIRFEESLTVGEDALFNMMVSRNMEKFYMLNKPLYNYRFNDASVVRKFDQNYAQKYLKSMQIAEKYIIEFYSDNKIVLKKLNNYVAYHVLLIIVNYCLNPENKLNFRESLNKVKEVCNIKEFKIAVKESGYEGFSLTRKITLFTIKSKLYFLTTIIGKFRQLQFKSRK